MIATTPATSHFIVNVGHSVNIPVGECRVFQVGSASIAVFRTRNGEVYATPGTCPLEGGPLSNSVMKGNKIVCSLHSCTFDIEAAAIKTFPAVVNPRGEILVTLDAISVGLR